MSKIILALYVIATSSGLIFIKLGTGEGLPIKIDGGKLQLHFNFFALVGILLYGASFALYIYLISKNDLGYIIPLTTALVYIVIFFASYILFHEVFTVMKVFGISLIVIGLIILNLKK